MSSIVKVLQIDHKYKHPGVDGDLHTLNKIESGKSLDYDTPTLVSPNFDYNNTVNLVSDIKEFKTLFYKKYKFLKNIDMDNLLIAGGSVSNIINKGSYNDSDVDFFVYGLDVDKANWRVEKWIIDIINGLKTKKKKSRTTKKSKSKKKDYSSDDQEEVDDDEDNANNENDNDITVDCTFIRNKNTIVILVNGIKVQIIFRLYKTISEILHGFDLGSSAVGFDGKEVYMTTLGKFCHEHVCNIVDVSRKSPSYEARLEKYFDRGFNIVLPYLDKNLLRTEYFKYKMYELCALPYFVFSYSDILETKSWSLSSIIHTKKLLIMKLTILTSTIVIESILRTWSEAITFTTHFLMTLIFLSLK